MTLEIFTPEKFRAIRAGNISVVDYIRENLDPERYVRVEKIYARNPETSRCIIPINEGVHKITRALDDYYLIFQSTTDLVQDLDLPPDARLFAECNLVITRNTGQQVTEGQVYSFLATSPTRIDFFMELILNYIEQSGILSLYLHSDIIKNTPLDEEIPEILQHISSITFPGQEPINLNYDQHMNTKLTDYQRGALK